jgi:hypothetical protein
MSAVRSSLATWGSPAAVRRELVGYGYDTHGQVAARVQDEEEMHELNDILPLPVALNRETEETKRHEMEPEKISLSDHLMGVLNICVVGTICGQRKAT